MPATVVVTGSYGQTLEQYGISVRVTPTEPPDFALGCDSDPNAEVVGYELLANWPDSLQLREPALQAGTKFGYSYGFSDPVPFRKGVTYTVWTCKLKSDANVLQVEWAIDAPKPPYYFRFVFS